MKNQLHKIRWIATGFGHCHETGVVKVPAALEEGEAIGPMSELQRRLLWRGQDRPRTKKIAYNCFNDPGLKLLARTSCVNMRQQICSLYVRAILLWMTTIELLTSVRFVLKKDPPFPTSNVVSIKVQILWASWTATEVPRRYELTW